MTRSEYQDLIEFFGTKFDAIDRRFDAIDGRLDRLEGRMDAIEGRVDAVEGRMDAVEGRMDAVEGRLTRVEVKVEENSHLIQLLAESLTSLREHMDREFAALRREMAEGFELQGSAIRNLAVRMDRWEGLSA